MVRFSAEVNAVLGVGFCLVGLLAALLQNWLWTFPMAPDPGGVDPNGVTTAPKFWRMVHRGLGYVFLGIYLVLLVQMVPRLWQFEPEAWSLRPVLHAVVGLGIGGILGLKIWILRRGQRFGKRLPLLGWSMVVLAFVAVGLVWRPAVQLQSIDPVSDGGFTFEEAAVMRGIVGRNCIQCHGLSVVAGGSDDGSMETLEEMAENAEDRGLADPAGGDRSRMAAFLEHVYFGVEDDDGDRRGRGGRKSDDRD